MKSIGYWMGNLLDAHLPLPQELVGEMPTATVAAVVNYLENGKLFETYRGWSWCRFRCGVKQELMGHREFSDGEWLWPEGLVHYVKVHKILLPEDFISCATGARKVMCVNDDRTESLDYWINWAKAYRTATFQDFLAKALEVARAAEQKQFENSVSEVEQRERLGSDKCIFAGCGRPVLLGRKICARHFLGENKLAASGTHLYKISDEIIKMAGGKS